MENDIVENNDPIQLQKMIVFLRADLAKYKNEVKRLRDSDYYSLVLRFERENVLLTNQKKELSMELLKLKRDFEKAKKNYYDHVQTIEKHKKKQISSIEALLKEKEELRAENKVLKESLKDKQDELLSVNSANGLENKLSDFAKGISQQIQKAIEAIENSRLEQAHADNLNQYLMKEIEEKLDHINRHNSTTNLLEERTMMKNDALIHLDAQVNKVLAQSIDFEDQVEHKLRILDDLEQKLNELATEIKLNEIKQ
ncbi:hypothetical protein [Lysinibacillus sp. NPDC047702]|uniref:hypothetical protein n=1 Tax=unclassified Lysinibacillus TaxID=2636778 RepID=UPI003D060CD3